MQIIKHVQINQRDKGDFWFRQCSKQTGNYTYNLKSYINLFSVFMSLSVIA